MTRASSAIRNFGRILVASALILTACTPGAEAQNLGAGSEAEIPTAHFSDPTALPTRPNYKPGELVDYIVQSGDNLPSLAARFNTSVAEILTANPFIPADATTMPAGMPMNIPVYFLPLWASPFQVIPDNAFVNGPTLIGFDTSAFVAQYDGWLSGFRTYAGGMWRTGAGLVDFVATNYSVSPRLLLAMLEYQTGALTNPEKPKAIYLLGYERAFYTSVYLQLVWMANTLNNGYYGWRVGNLTSFDLEDGSLFRPDPGANAATVGIQYFYAQVYGGLDYSRSVGPLGLARTYAELFGDPWADTTVIIPGSLRQPELPLPFPPGQVWTYTGGPHTGWGSGEPFTAVDFAPPVEKSGCVAVDAKNYVTAMADGLIVRSELGTVVLDLDKDGNERTGWVIFYLHLATRDRVPLGLEVKRGDFVGYPSCEGGQVTGTHVHIARKYNGEWIPADGPLAFVLDGWTVQRGDEAYLGTLVKGAQVITACTCSDSYTQIASGLNP